MRGKPYAVPVARMTPRITPADAGKTYAPRSGMLRMQDHPRGCGENYEQLVGGVETLGSPPRMRGKPFIVDGSTWKVRITPADAGKTLIVSVAGHAEEDHPRGCGENQQRCSSRRTRNGSPPRMRGKPHCCIQGIALPRITPADAGKT